MVSQTSIIEKRKSLLRNIFSTYELKVIAETCSIDSISLEFDYDQITNIESCDGMLRVYYETQGVWMMSIDTFNNLQVVAEARLELNKTIEFHGQSLINRHVA